MNRCPRSPSPQSPFLKTAETDLISLLTLDQDYRPTLVRLFNLWQRAGYLREGALYRRVKTGASWDCVAASFPLPPGSKPGEQHQAALDAPLGSLAEDAALSGRQFADYRVFRFHYLGRETGRLVVVPTPSYRLHTGRGESLVDSRLYAALGLILSSEANQTSPELNQNHEEPTVSSVTPWSELRPKFPEFVGESPQLQALLTTIEKVATAEASVLIYGESGTGKELIGRAIHRLSGRTGRAFVTENCAALSESLLEAEVFGWERGAFTGADRSQAGLVEKADRGTLFLDEIGEMSQKLQSKLLRVLQEREVRRIGGKEPRSVDFRLLCATHRDLSEEVKEGRFREDLLFRIDVVQVRVPALRERPLDIGPLARHFLTLFSVRAEADPPRIENCALRALQSYAWPGNVRELQNEMERAVALSTDVIRRGDLSPRVTTATLASSVTQKVREEVGTNLYGLERAVLGGVIQEVLEETGGNKARAARILGVPKTNLYRRIDRYGLNSRLKR